MTEPANILAIIPARGGSKGIPNKNIIDLCGKPLIAWSIEASLKAPSISKVVVSSDDINILEAAQLYGAEAIVRPKELATDTAEIVPVIEHVINTLKGELVQYQYVALIQPTSPMRTFIHIEQAYNLLLKEKGDAVISVEKVDSSTLKYFITDSNGHLKGICNDKFPFFRRQDLPPVYKPNGAIYIINTKIFCGCKSLMTSSTIPYVMEASVSLDVDTPEDLERARALLSNKR